MSIEQIVTDLIFIGLVVLSAGLVVDTLKGNFK